MKTLLNQIHTRCVCLLNGWVTIAEMQEMVPSTTEDNWLKVALGLLLSLVGTALIAFIVYATPKLNQISESQAIIMTTLNNQSHWQVEQCQINKYQAVQNQQFSVDIAQLQTSVNVNAGQIRRHEVSDRNSLKRLHLSMIRGNDSEH